MNELKFYQPDNKKWVMEIHMKEIDAQDLWELIGRLEDAKRTLFKAIDAIPTTKDSYEVFGFLEDKNNDTE